MTARPWTEDEIGFLQDNPTMAPRHVAEELGRTVRAVQMARKALIAGELGRRLKTRWTEDEDAAVIEAGPFTSAKSLLEILPGRSEDAINKRRRKLGLVTYTTIGERPGDVGNRALVAKSCVRCGLLLAGAWFTFHKPKRGWSSTCRACASEKAGLSKQAARANESARVAERRKAEYQKLQRLTVDRAEKAGEPYTDADFEVLADQSLTDFQKALRLRRSYGAVQGARQRAGFKSKPDGLGDPERDIWVIRNPSQCAHEGAAA